MSKRKFTERKFTSRDWLFSVAGIGLLIAICFRGCVSHDVEAQDGTEILTGNEYAFTVTTLNEDHLTDIQKTKKIYVFYSKDDGEWTAHGTVENVNPEEEYEFGISEQSDGKYRWMSVPENEVGKAVTGKGNMPDPNDCIGDFVMIVDSVTPPAVRPVYKIVYDLNRDGAFNIVDVQVMINELLGVN